MKTVTELGVNKTTWTDLLRTCCSLVIAGEHRHSVGYKYNHMEIIITHLWPPDHPGRTLSLRWVQIKAHGDIYYAPVAP